MSEHCLTGFFDVNNNQMRQTCWKNCAKLTCVSQIDLRKRRARQALITDVFLHKIFPDIDFPPVCICIIHTTKHCVTRQCHSGNLRHYRSLGQQSRLAEYCCLHLSDSECAHVNELINVRFFHKNVIPKTESNF